MKTTLENNTLTLFLEGRVDTNNASAVEAELFAAVNANPGAEIVVDVEKLEYISSAGLRVLMKLRKQAKKALPVLNVSREVYEIFDTTGFTELLDVRKALRQISIEGCEMIGAGASGKVYRIDGDTIVKVFDPQIGLERIDNERKNAKTAFVNGIPTAITYDVVRVGDCYGTVYELIDSVQLSKFLRDHPEQAQEYQVKYAMMMKRMHQIPMSEEFQDIKALYRKWIGDLKPFFTQEETDALNRLLDAIPDRDTFVHCDCHVGNVMVQNGELVLIDMADVGRGHPIFDIGSEFFHYKISPSSPSRDFALKTLLGFTPETNEFTDGIWDTLAKTYFQPQNEQEYRAITAIAFAAGLLRSTVTAAKHQQLPQEHKQLIVSGTKSALLPKIDEFISLFQKMDAFFARCHIG